MNLAQVHKPRFILLDGSMGSYIGKDNKTGESSLFNKIWSAAALALPELTIGFSRLIWNISFLEVK